MTDSESKQDVADSEDSALLLRLDVMLQRYQRENPSLIREPEPQGIDNMPAIGAMTEQQSALLPSPEASGIPLLTEKIELAEHDWPVQTDISELLCFAFDNAIREAQITLDPVARLTLLRALGKRLPKNF
ncbi:MAG: hypothetical protein RQ714_03160 [Nitrosomonas sp.]|nr:hypothetical protein [Nitrosomonas sp.]